MLNRYCVLLSGIASVVLHGALILVPAGSGQSDGQGVRRPIVAVLLPSLPPESHAIARKVAAPALPKPKSESVAASAPVMAGAADEPAALASVPLSSVPLPSLPMPSLPMPSLPLPFPNSPMTAGRVATAMERAVQAQQKMQYAQRVSGGITNLAARLAPLVQERIDCVQLGDSGFQCTPEPSENMQRLLSEMFSLAREARHAGVSGNSLNLQFDEQRRVAMTLE